VKNYNPGLWVCGTCGRHYDGNPDGTWNGTTGGDISRPCLCAVKFQPGSRPFDSPAADVNQSAASIVDRATRDR